MTFINNLIKKADIMIKCHQLNDTQARKVNGTYNFNFHKNIFNWNTLKKNFFTFSFIPFINSLVELIITTTTKIYFFFNEIFSFLYSCFYFLVNWFLFKCELFFTIISNFLYKLYTGFIELEIIHFLNFFLSKIFDVSLLTTNFFYIKYLILNNINQILIATGPVPNSILFLISIFFILFITLYIYENEFKLKYTLIFLCLLPFFFSILLNFIFLENFDIIIQNLFFFISLIFLLIFIIVGAESYYVQEQKNLRTSEMFWFFILLIFFGYSLFQFNVSANIYFIIFEAISFLTIIILQFSVKKHRFSILASARYLLIGFLPTIFVLIMVVFFFANNSFWNIANYPIISNGNINLYINYFLSEQTFDTEIFSKRKKIQQTLPYIAERNHLNEFFFFIETYTQLGSGSKDWFLEQTSNFQEVLKSPEQLQSNLDQTKKMFKLSLNTQHFFFENFIDIIKNFVVKFWKSLKYVISLYRDFFMCLLTGDISWEKFKNNFLLFFFEPSDEQNFNSLKEAALSLGRSGSSPIIYNRGGGGGDRRILTYDKLVEKALWVPHPMSSYLDVDIIWQDIESEFLVWNIDEYIKELKKFIKNNKDIIEEKLLEPSDPLWAKVPYSSYKMMLDLGARAYEIDKNDRTLFFSCARMGVLSTISKSTVLKAAILEIQANIPPSYTTRFVYERYCNELYGPYCKRRN